MPEDPTVNREEKENRKKKKESVEPRKEDRNAESVEMEEAYIETADQRSFERILQRSGRGSVAVILPRSWVDKGALKVHDRIFLKWEQDGSLKLDPLRRAQDENTIFIIDANHGKPAHCLGRTLISAYIEGYSAVKITSGNELTKEQHEDVIAHASKLIGLAVVGEGLNSVIIRCYLDPLKNDISQLFVRIYSLSSAMVRLSLDALMNSNLDAADRVKNLDGEVDKIYYLILRQLFTALRNPIIADSLKIERPLNIVSDRAVAQMIEDIGDTCHNACTKLITFAQTPALPKELLPKAQEFSERICQLYDRTFRAYSLSDYKSANNVIDDCRAFEIAVEEFERSTVENGASILKYAFTTELELLARQCRSIAEIAFNRAIGVDSEDVRIEDKEPIRIAS